MRQNHDYGGCWGLPIAVKAGSASPHESKLVEPLSEFITSVDLPERLIGEKAYDSDKLDAHLAQHGVQLTSSQRSNRKPENKTQDGRSLRRYQRDGPSKEPSAGSKTTAASVSAWKNPPPYSKASFTFLVPSSL